MSMRNYSIYTLKTKLEFTNLYQYLSEKDYKQLEQQILCHSYHTPICTWNGIVINGIEAYELFRKHSIPFRIKRLHFSSKEDVISWICTDQLKREDLTNINKKYLIGKKYDAEKIIVSRQLSSTNKSHISGASIAAKKISEECNVAMATVYKYSAYSSALDIIDEKVPDFVKRVRSGQLWISQANIIELSGLPKEQLLSLNNYLLAEKIEHLSYHDMKESSVSIPSIRNLPQFDPDAEIARLTLTIPSWNSSIERVLKVSDFKIASDTAKYKLKYQLMCLISTTNNILKKLEEIPKIYKSLFPKCILSKYLLKIYVQIKIINVIFPSNTFSVLQLILTFIR